MFRLAKNVDIEGLSAVIKQVGRIDRSAISELRTELQTELRPTAKAIASKIPTKAPLSGFKRGRLRWSKVQANVKLTPSRIRRGGTDAGVSISMFSAKGAFELAEVVGSDNLAQRSQPRTKSATRYGKTYSRPNPKSRSQTFQANLNERAPWRYSAGRYGFGYFLREKKDIQKIVSRILEKHQKKLTKIVEKAR